MLFFSLLERRIAPGILKGNSPVLASFSYFPKRPMSSADSSIEQVSEGVEKLYVDPETGEKVSKSYVHDYEIGFV